MISSRASDFMKKSKEMETEQKRQLIERLQGLRNGGEDTLCIHITATSGEISIENRQIINSILDFMLKELRTDIAREVENG